MNSRSCRKIALGATIALCATAPAAQAGDFFSALFGGFGMQRHEPQPSTQLPYASESNPLPPQGTIETRPRVAYSRGGGQAFCVRTCDGRYFPLPAAAGESRAASCNSFCPASETKVVYGGTIDSAATESGKPYSELPNAFRYRKELVAGCTCNGKDQFGLAQVKIERDPTLRKGDIVAEPGGLMVAGRAPDKRNASLNFSPVPGSLRSRYQHLPVVASE